MDQKIANLAECLYGEHQSRGREEIAQVISQLGLTGKDLDRAFKFVNEQETTNAHRQLRFVIPGNPPISKRPRASRIRNGAGAVVGIRVHAADGDDQRTMRSEILARLSEDHVPFAGEVELTLEIYRPMLASWPPYKQLLAELGYLRADKKPDWDNHAKLVTDAMRGIVFVDDSLVVVGSVVLMYSRRPRLEVTVSGRDKSLTR